MKVEEILEAFEQLSGKEQYELMRKMSTSSKATRVIENLEYCSIDARDTYIRPAVIPVFVDPMDFDMCGYYDGYHKFIKHDKISEINYAPLETTLELDAQNVDGYIRNEGNYYWCFPEDQEEQKKLVDAVGDAAFTQDSLGYWDWDDYEARAKLEELRETT